MKRKKGKNREHTVMEVLENIMREITRVRLKQRELHQYLERKLFNEKIGYYITK